MVETTGPIRPNFHSLLLLGAGAGILSGLFGIGGGVVIVPALVLLLGLPHKLAAGTSVAAILPAAIVGAVSYGSQGNVDWIVALCLALGMVIGAQAGSVLLSRLPAGAIQWGFLGFLIVVIVSLWVIVPQRTDQVDVGLLTTLLLTVTGFITGIASGLLGVGGGIIVVPVLMIFFGANDLVAKGSSLVMMIPGSISGTLGNVRRRNVDLRTALVLGTSACVMVPFSSMLAAWINPELGNILFSAFLAVIFVQMLLRQIKSMRRERAQARP